MLRAADESNQANRKGPARRSVQPLHLIKVGAFLSLNMGFDPLKGASAVNSASAGAIQRWCYTALALASSGSLGRPPPGD